MRHSDRLCADVIFLNTSHVRTTTDSIIVQHVITDLRGGTWVGQPQTANADNNRIQLKISLEYEDHQWEHVYDCNSTTSTDASGIFDIKISAYAQPEHDTHSNLAEHAISGRKDGDMILATIKPPSIKQWWPTGNGSQPLYTVRLTLQKILNGAVVCCFSCSKLQSMC